MPIYRHHIHVICTADDKPLVWDDLAIFFQTRAFLTFDISSQFLQAAAYSRQCIESCDYVLIIVGNSYDTNQNTGVSQMHLSYINARTKIRPMLALIKTHTESAKASRQLQDFTRVIEQQTNHVYYYDEHNEIEQILTYAYQDMISSYEPILGWERANKGRAAIQLLNVPQCTDSLAHGMPAQHSDIKNGSTETHHPINKLAQTIKLDDHFTVEYNAQAYEGGNLSDITMTMALSGKEILNAVAQIPAAFSSYGLQSCLNRLIATKAEEEIKQCMPDVHAISRCQIIEKDLLKIKQLLVTVGWIKVIASNEQTAQALWKLSAYAKKMFEKNKINNLS